MIGNSKNPRDLLSGGWPSKKYFLFSWALSCQKLIKHYGNVELHTDSLGKEILIDHLRLPFTSVNVSLDALDKYNNRIWTIGKLYTYALQTEPFLHVDSDVFIWRRFTKKLSSAELIAQSLENNHRFYFETLKTIQHTFKLPTWLEKAIDEKNEITVSNTGIVGGSNVEFFQMYAEEAIKIVKQNSKNLHRVNSNVFSILIEQLLFYILSKRNNISVEYFSKIPFEPNADYSFIKAHAVPGKVKFIHPLGPYKKLSTVCEAVDFFLRDEFPESHHKILHLLRNGNL